MEIEIRQYKARPNSRLNDAQAAQIGPVLERLHASGKSTATDIVEAAHAGDSPLHPHFEWDDQRAAQLYREAQARRLAQSIVIQVRDCRTGEESEMRAFHAVVAEGDPEQSVKRYVPVRVVQADADLSKQVVQNAYRDLIGWQDKYSRYRKFFRPFDEQFGGVFREIEAVAESQRLREDSMAEF